MRSRKSIVHNSSVNVFYATRSIYGTRYARTVTISLVRKRLLTTLVMEYTITHKCIVNACLRGSYGGRKYTFT